MNISLSFPCVLNKVLSVSWKGFSCALWPRSLTKQHYLLWPMYRLAPSCWNLEIIHRTQWPLKNINSRFLMLNSQSWRMRCFLLARRRISSPEGGHQSEAHGADQCFQGSNSINHKCWEPSPSSDSMGHSDLVTDDLLNLKGCGAGLS